MEIALHRTQSKSNRSLASSLLTPYSYITSRIVAIRTTDNKAFHVHSALLCRESHRFRTSLSGEYNEARNLTIKLEEESAAQFALFVEFLYRPDWQLSRESGSDLVLLAKLYAMGERFMAERFQDVVLDAFNAIARIDVHYIAIDVISALLNIACNEITERPYPHDDAMREHIFWVTSYRLLDLRQAADFHTILDANEGLAKQLLLRAGAVQSSPPLYENRLTCPRNVTQRRQLFGSKH